MKILVTGGLGYIGSHTVVELIKNNYEVVIVDNLSNCKREVIERLEFITERKIPLYVFDVCDKEKLREVFLEHEVDGVIHFAGYKAVGESVNKPLMYYRNNIDSTLSLCEVMEEFNCFNLVFSSSATVYGTPKELPIKEDSSLSTTNPYGTTKLFIEQILTDLTVANKSFNVTILRYFNPIGAHKSRLLGEEPNGIPNNLMPYIVKVANKELECLSIFGNDYDTVDGTGVRDYIHVEDLASGHVAAIKNITNNNGVKVYNLGTGNGFSVLELINTFKAVNNVEIPYKIVERRAGDIASCFADTTKAYEELGFKAQKNLDDMCRSAWEYVSKSK